VTSARSLLGEIATIGRDPRSGGFHRFAFTREDAALAEWFVAACEARGLDLVTDRCGNQWAWWGDPDAGSPGRGGVVTGSHLDSVPDGGAFDGPLGVVSALAAVDRLRAQGVVPGRPLGVVRFVDEEGARFGLACSGSRMVTGRVDPAQVLARSDRDGTSYAEALRASGTDPATAGRDDETLRRIGAFVELHVEQGRALATPVLDAPVGVASVIRPHGRWRIALTGRADHAGTTLLSDRRDPMLDLARLLLLVRSAAERAGALATIGKLEVAPNAVNAVPGSVLAWLDARADDARQVAAVVEELQAAGFGPEPESWTPATAMDSDLSDQVAAAVTLADGRPPPRLATGAGHDAGVLAEAGLPAAMLFVRNPTGISHSPQEWAAEADCERGVDLLTAVLGRLCAAQPEQLS
jgi:beta-ureidopropionase / N-carbamoyl-L-amino-acid hydrolase